MDIPIEKILEPAGIIETRYIEGNVLEEDSLMDLDKYVTSTSFTGVLPHIRPAIKPIDLAMPIKKDFFKKLIILVLSLFCLANTFSVNLNWSYTMVLA